MHSTKIQCHSEPNILTYAVAASIFRRPRNIVIFAYQNMLKYERGVTIHIGSIKGI
jgi:hypothetical protein